MNRGGTSWAEALPVMLTKNSLPATPPRGRDITCIFHLFPLLGLCVSASQPFIGISYTLLSSLSYWDSPDGLLCKDSTQVHVVFNLQDW